MTEQIALPPEGEPAKGDAEATKPDFTNALRMQRRMIEARSNPDDPFHSLFLFSDEIHEQLDGPYTGPREIM